MANNGVTYKYLGKSGLKVSTICLGTMTFGHKENYAVQCDEEQSHAILDKFVEMGGNFIDTADVYTGGSSEKIIGNWLSRQKDRSRLILATKAHAWDDGTPIEETFTALNDLVSMGKVRYIGVSNVTGWQLQKIVDMCNYRQLSPITTLQQQWSLLTRETEYELVDVCQNEGVGVLPWSPLKGGWLSGKIQRDGELEKGSRIAWTSEDPARLVQSHPTFDQFNNDRVWKLLDTIKTIGSSHGKSVAQVSLKWLLEKDVVSSVVIGAKNLKQLEDNMGAGAEWNLSKEDMNILNDLSMPNIPYPYEMVSRVNKTRKR
ncbi:DgyrCDS6801 [Dimorphilus gyrociliatus]|uniref:DgyrCDS6801 n=1 Tax=Dimorphilus gyrociliatus TaxID=2664684 RepID=A0A7I8VP34_9ANNE|nr:DgyrCDS6801 [Dimorphilus gyrociliatus]